MEGGKYTPLSRREWLQRGTLLVLAGALPGWGLSRAAEAATPPRRPWKGAGAVPEVTSVEDLMREHGVLRRTLLVYEAIRDRVQAGKEFPPQVLVGAAGLIRKFVENYHEKLEEGYVFPRFEKAGQLVELVGVLRRQHQAGRGLTGEILKLAAPGGLKTPESRQQLTELLGLFLRMYRPHAAREDTVLFPAFRALVPAKEYTALGEEFEDREVALFGPEGFERMVGEVTGLEKQLGIYDLAQFTPQI